VRDVQGVYVQGVYVDLSAVGTGDGTSASPWNWSQFYADVSAATPVTISADANVYLRGGVDITNSPSGTKQFIGDNYFNMLPWSLSGYGPWRIYDSNYRIHLNKVYSMEGGIIITDVSAVENIGGPIFPRPGISLFSKEINNCFIKAQALSIKSIDYSSLDSESININAEDFDGGWSTGIYCGQVYSASDINEININGSTLVSYGSYNFGILDLNHQSIDNLNIDVRNNTLINIKDSVIHISYFNMLSHYFDSIPNSAVNINNEWVVTSADSINILSGTSGNGSLIGEIINFSATNMQYGWSPSVPWPSYSADRDDLAYSVLGDGITISGSGEW